MVRYSRLGFVTAAAAAALLVAPAAAAAPSARPSLQNSFRLGTGGDTLCRVQNVAADPALTDMFDRAWSIVCRDAAQPVGRLYALRKAGGNPLERLTPLRRQVSACQGGGEARQLESLGAVTVSDCTFADADVRYRIYAHETRRTVYVAEGLTGYDSALRLGLRTIVADRFVPGEVSIATTDAGDPAAFARVQAGSLDADQALEEGYRRNNSGYYAESAEFFESLLQRPAGEGTDGRRRTGEYLVNRALQRSNLGAFAEADALFARAELIRTADPVELRLRRNFRVLHLLNQRKYEEARLELAEPLQGAEPAPAGGGRPTIDAAAAALVNAANPLSAAAAGTQSSNLTPEERVAILDAQTLLLGATLDRLQGRPAEAAQGLSRAEANLLAVRDGRVTSIARLRSQALSEQSILAEQSGDAARAERLLGQAVAVLAVEYPASAAVAAANARLAAFYARRGQTDKALSLYREIVARAGEGVVATNVSSDLLAPYLALLAREIPTRPELVSDFFLAAETLARPGVASTQAVLARELSAGDDEAARMFRQAVNLTREAEQTRVAIARLSVASGGDGAAGEQIARLTAELEALQASQAAAQAKLADYPRYQAVSTKALTLEDLRRSLREGEAYLKLAEAGGAVYAMLVTPADATAYRTSLSARQLERDVQALRDSISVMQDGQVLTYPFDLERARRVYSALFAPVAVRLSAARHIIFEPAGAMLKLPLNLLVVDDTSLATYAARAPADEFDFRQVAWLGRDRDITTSVSARSFRDVRALAPSRARLDYLGLGENRPIPPMVALTAARSAEDGVASCAWPLSQWNNPISARELLTARSVIGAGRAELLTGAAFTDAALKQRRDLTAYRILHFATHGLVSAPRPECPAEPALLTSFETGAGALQSDGLLSFREIFDLRLDADLVILSACDTAAAASTAATREAGLSSGGDFALDGLVRAFVGAGGRSVVASHWPLPDNFGATERLISGMFQAEAGMSIAGALRTAQRRLMDEAATSHPYYWSGFAIIGDGTRPVLASR